MLVSVCSHQNSDWRLTSVQLYEVLRLNVHFVCSSNDIGCKISHYQTISLNLKQGM